MLHLFEQLRLSLIAGYPVKWGSEENALAFVGYCFLEGTKVKLIGGPFEGYEVIQIIEINKVSS